MCGIGGVVARVPQDRDRLHAFMAALSHRGPDDAGLVQLGTDEITDGLPDQGPVEQAVLIHRRLSILDLSEAGHQPMASADGRHVIVFNGEVYNYLELRAELEALGHAFRTDTDTEVVLAACREWGPVALTRFVGMFAFGLVDRNENTLFLARDFLGIKPLYYSHRPEGLAFASEIAPLFELPWVPRTAGIARIHHYLTTVHAEGRNGTETFFDHVRRLPPAHWMRIRLDDPAPTAPVRYWGIDPKNHVRMPYHEAVVEVRERFMRNVALHLRSDVPVGAALSGGIDSSAILMAMRRIAGPEQEIHTFSYIPHDERISEEKWVDLVGAAAHATMHKVRPDVAAFTADLPRLIRHQGEPFGSTSIYAQYCVFRAAQAAGIKVTLDGQGADEILAGYRHYYPARLASLLLSGHAVGAARAFRSMTKMPGVTSKGLALDTAARLVPRRLLGALSRARLAGRHLRPDWLDEGWFRRQGIRPGFDPRTARHALRNDLRITATEAGLPTLLRYADRNSMAFSVESRVPFLTPDFVAFLLALPEEYHIGPDGTTKRVFRDAMRGLVPDAVLDRKDKIGFQTTEADWLRTMDDRVRETLNSETAKRIPFLRIEPLREQWDDIVAGRSDRTADIWRCLNLIWWTDAFDVQYDSEQASAVPTESTPATDAAAPVAPAHPSSPR